MSKLNKIEYLQIEVSDKSLNYLAAAGFDPVYGARPLKRAIQQYLENPLAQDILQGNIKPKSKIFVEYGAQGLKFIHKKS